LGASESLTLIFQKFGTDQAKAEFKTDRRHSLYKEGAGRYVVKPLLLFCGDRVLKKVLGPDILTGEGGAWRCVGIRVYVMNRSAGWAHERQSWAKEARS
jgi:hypothetical protein